MANSSTCAGGSKTSTLTILLFLISIRASWTTGKQSCQLGHFVLSQLKYPTVLILPLAGFCAGLQVISPFVCQLSSSPILYACWVKAPTLNPTPESTTSLQAGQCSVGYTVLKFNVLPIYLAQSSALGSALSFFASTSRFSAIASAAWWGGIFSFLECSRIVAMVL